MKKKDKLSIVLILSLSLLSLGCEQESAGNQKQNIASDYTSRAESYTKQGQYKVALIELKNAIKADPSYLDAHLLYAKILFEQGNHINSIGVLQSLGVKDGRVSLLLIRNNLQLGKANTALEIIKETQSNGQLKDSAELLIVEAKANTILGKHSRAIELIQEARRETSDKKLLSEAETVSASLSRKESKTEQAALALSKALKLDPSNIEAMILMAALNHTKGNLEEAEDQLSKALYTLPTTDTITLKRLKILKAMTLILSEQGRTSEALVYSKLIAEASPSAQKIESNYEEALEALKSGDYAKAEKLLEALYEKYNLKKSGALLGFIKTAQGDYDSASSLFRESIDPEVASEKALALYAGTELKLKNPNLALEAIESNIKQDTQNTQLLSIYGVALLSAGQEEKALEVIKSTLAINPDLPRLRLALASIHNNSGNYDSALKELELADTSKNKESLVEEKLLIQYRFMKKETMYKQYIETLASREPVESQILAGLALLRSDPKKANKLITNAYTREPSNTKVLSAKVLASMNQKDYTAALKHSNELLTINENDRFALTSAATAINLSSGENDAINYLKNHTKKSINIWASDYVLSEHYLSKLQYDKSIKHINASLAKSSFNQIVTEKAVQIFTSSASAELKNSNHEEAKKHALEAIQLAPNDTNLLRLLVIIDLKNGNVKQAKEVSKRIEESEPNSYNSFLANGDISKAENNIEAALDHYVSAWKLNPNNQTGRLIWTNSSQNTARITQSEFLTLWIETLPDSYEPITIKAITLQQQGKNNEAINTYEKSLNMNSSQPIALNNTAWLLFNINQIDKALSYAEKAHTLSPENPAILDTYGWILYKSGDKTKASTLIEKASKLAPGNSEIKEHLYIISN